MDDVQRNGAVDDLAGTLERVRGPLEVEFPVGDNGVRVKVIPGDHGNTYYEVWAGELTSVPDFADPGAAAIFALALDRRLETAGGLI